MQFDLENSVAAVLSDDDKVAGTAFLFRKDDAFCYWFTCHHVIADLAALRLGLGFEDRKPKAIVAADYVVAHSAADQDVAVLKTPSGASLAAYVPLPMGRVRVGETENLPSRGIGFTPKNTTTFPGGQAYPGTLSRGQEPSVNLQLATPPESVLALGNPWNTPAKAPRSAIAMLMFASDHVAIEGGFSGGPVIMTTNHGTPLCVGMLCQVFKNREQLAFAIDFSVLVAAAGNLIPFYPYADCVVLALVARLDEITPYVSAAHVLNGRPLAEVYDQKDRDRWNCLNDGTSLKALMDRVDTEQTLQLASIYLDDFSHLKEFIVKNPGPLCFIVDCCSFAVPELREIFGEADRRHFHAAYLFPMPDTRFTATQKDELRQQRQQCMPEVFGADWIDDRRDECSRPEEFAKRLEPLIEASAKVATQMVTEKKRQQFLRNYGMRPAPVSKLPTLSLGNDPALSAGGER
jgi:hypothetical protein